MAFSSPVRAGVLVQFKMMDPIGTIDVELFEQDKPATVGNFLRYIQEGQWHDQVFDRWEPGFVLQGGMYKVPHMTNLMTHWTNDPVQISTNAAIPFERDVGRFFSNTYGTLAMARVGTNVNSAAAAWFFNMTNNVQLDAQDGGYTVFGRIVRGTNTLNLFYPPSGTGKIFNIFQTSVPVYTDDPNRVQVYYITSDIVALTAKITRARAANQISWGSVAGRPNVVEFTRVMPAVWETLQTVTGTGDTMSVVDNGPTDGFRYYRVRIDYSN